MTYQVRLKPSAEKELRKLPDKDYQRISSALIGLATDPYGGKKLSGPYSGFYSMRVWPYRIIYTLVKSELVILVVKIGHRQGVYR